MSTSSLTYKKRLMKIIQHMVESPRRNFISRKSMDMETRRDMARETFAHI